MGVSSTPVRGDRAVPGDTPTGSGCQLQGAAQGLPCQSRGQRGRWGRWEVWGQCGGGSGRAGCPGRADARRVQISVVNRRLTADPPGEYPVAAGLVARGWSVHHAWLDELGETLARGAGPACAGTLGASACTIVRSQPGVPIAAALEAAGFPVVNRVAPRVLADDKWLGHLALTAAGVPAVPSWLWPDPATRLPVTGPVVTKTHTGSQGAGVHRHAELAAAQTCFAAGPRDAYIVQPYVATGEDWRVVVAGTTPVCWVRRRPGPGEWRTNHALGGIADAPALPAGFAEVAVAATVGLGLDYAGVDLIVFDGGPAVLEVNANPGWVEPQRMWGPASYEAYPLAVEARLSRSDRSDRSAPRP